MRDWPSCSSTWAAWAPRRNSKRRERSRPRPTGAAGGPASALVELELDATVAAQGDLVAARIERLIFAEAGCDEAPGRNPLIDQEFHDRYGTRGRQFPVRDRKSTRLNSSH